MNSPLVDDFSGFDEAVLDRATALGRRDGLVGQWRDIVLEGFAHGLLRMQTTAAGCILGAAFRQCYAAGHRHGAEVRRENEARRRRAEIPILSLLPGERISPFRLLPGAPSWAGGAGKNASVQATP